MKGLCADFSCIGHHILAEIVYVVLRYLPVFFFTNACGSIITSKLKYFKNAIRIFPLTREYKFPNWKGPREYPEQTYTKIQLHVKFKNRTKKKNNPQSTHMIQRERE